MKVILYIILSLLIVVQSGCLSMTTQQSGRTVGRSNLELMANATIGRYSHNSIFDDQEYDHKPVIEIGGTYGLLNNLDLTVKFNSATFLSTQVKYQFIGNRESLFATSIGAEAGFVPLYTFVGIMDYYVSMPLFASLHPHEKISLFLSPRYVFASSSTFAHPDNAVPEPPDRINFVGNAYGIIIGKKHKGILEIAHFDRRITRPTQVTLGYVVTIRSK